MAILGQKKTKKLNFFGFWTPKRLKTAKSKGGGLKKARNGPYLGLDA